MPKPIPIKWSCGVVASHEHDSFDEAEACIRAHCVSAPFGFCPTCGERGYQRDPGGRGNDKCEGGHVYPTYGAVGARG